jgi:RNA polymerase-binding protein DksA
MTGKERAKFRELLYAMGESVRGDHSLLKAEALEGVGGESSGSFSDVPLHMADLGTHHAEEEMTLTLLESEEQLFEEINTALARIDDGTFGTCEVCHRPIAKKRLEALPFARTCIRCARASEAAPSR